MLTYAEYFADPFVLRLADGTYVAYGTGAPPAAEGPVFEALTSSDLLHWHSHGRVLMRLSDAQGDEYWAPEVVEADGVFWMYYSVGHGISGHHIRVARAETPLGPFIDQGVNLTPDESFAIDAHPFRDVTGQWFLFFAHDVLDDARPGTHLAVMPLADMTHASGPTVRILSPNADWQIYERDRQMYDATYNWHTLEGPTVVRRQGRYWMTYSGGAWTGEGYAVSWAVAEKPLGPWHHAPAGSDPLLRTADELIGPGHNSVTIAPDGSDAIVFHAWDRERTARRMFVDRIAFRADGPRVGESPVTTGETPQ